MIRSIRLWRAHYSGVTSPLGQRLRVISNLERREEARAFVELYGRESGRSANGTRRRWSEVRRALNRHGTYEHTPEELAYGARVAWRNHGRCIGRLFWESLEVADCRNIREPDAIMARMVDHMREALGDGRIKSMISVFAPMGNEAAPYIESAQMTQYAGYHASSNTSLGDRRNIEVTRIAESLGHKSPEVPTAFDMLPVIIRDRHERRHIFPVPDHAYKEIPIVHPLYQAVAELGLKWYAVPCVSNMIMSIGGIDYPCAPFNGFYMGTEIGSRNFADKFRYDMLPRVAEVLGLNTNNKTDPLWKDRALTELNAAVLHSYKISGVSMLDHHAANSQFLQFQNREQTCGRRVAADWRWIVPPQASAACDVFHLKMRNYHPVPNYYFSRADDGKQLMPFYGDQDRSRLESAYDRVVRRWKLWKRMAW